MGAASCFKRMQLFLRKWRWQLVDTAVMLPVIILLMLWWSVPNTAILAEQNPTTTAFIELRRQEAEEKGQPFKLRWQWRRISEISRYLRVAVVLAEDYGFYHHTGAEYRAMWSAAESAFSGERAGGGSTITQQLAKNLYLSPQRSMRRKLRELCIATRLESDLSKTRILELYLNVVEWGDGIFGAQAAALAWFGRNASSLTPSQAAQLAVALPNPFVRSPPKQRGELRRKAANLVYGMQRLGLLSKDETQAALADLGFAKAASQDESSAPVDQSPATPPAAQETDANQPITTPR